MDYGYTVYIDEAGDSGLRSTRPNDVRGNGEWLVLGAAVFSAEHDREVSTWLNSIRQAAQNTQSDYLHFRKLSDRQKRIVCQKVADLPLRLFVVISNKRNMHGHRNVAAAQVSQSPHWYYWWLTRLLLERVTAFCAHRNRLKVTPDRKVRVVFARQKGMRPSHFTDYFTRIWAQGPRAKLNRRTIDWSVFDFSAVSFVEASSRAGLQFADIVASAHFQAVNTIGATCTAEHAIALSPRICRLGGSATEGGFAVWPPWLKIGDLDEPQRAIFQHHGAG